MDMSSDEFRSKYLTLKFDVAKSIKANRVKPLHVKNAPEEFNWKDQGAVRRVKDQMQCGSCWAFSTTGNIEGQYTIKYNENMTFSEAQLVDCDDYDSGKNLFYIYFFF